MIKSSLKKLEKRTDCAESPIFSQGISATKKIILGIMLFSSVLGSKLSAQTQYFTGGDVEILSYVNKAFDQYQKGNETADFPYEFINNKRQGRLWKNKHLPVWHDSNNNQFIEVEKTFIGVENFALSKDNRLRNIIGYREKEGKKIYLCKKPGGFVSKAFQGKGPTFYTGTFIEKNNRGTYPIGFIKEPGIWIENSTIESPLFINDAGLLVNNRGKIARAHTHPKEDDIRMGTVEQHRIEGLALFAGGTHQLGLGHEITKEFGNKLFLDSHTDFLYAKNTKNQIITTHNSLLLSKIFSYSSSFSLGIHGSLDQEYTGSQGKNIYEITPAVGMSALYISNQIQSYIRFQKSLIDNNVSTIAGIQLHQHGTQRSYFLQGRLGGEEQGIILGSERHPYNPKYSTIRIGPLINYTGGNKISGGMKIHYGL